MGQPETCWSFEAGEHEGIYPAIFDLDKLRDFRHREAFGDAFRRPETYGILTRPEQHHPFVRIDREGHPLPGRRL